MEIDTPIEDSNPFLDEPPQEAPLPYDDVPETENGSTSKLASRIGAGRVYLLSESSASLYGRIGGKVSARNIHHIIAHSFSRKENLRIWTRR